MKTIIEINGTNYSSTGNIALNIAKEARNENFDVYTFCKNSKKTKEFVYDNQFYIGSRIERLISEQLSYVTGFKDSFNIFGTRKLIKKIKELKPDLIHLHIMHDTFINAYMLFDFLAKSNIPVVWTFHDCYPITGQCVYFDICNCEKWKKGCSNCPQLHRYPESYLFDKTKYLWKQKKTLFNNINKLTIVTPSLWLSNLIKESFLKSKNVIVINNGIDLEKFHPTNSDFREKYNLTDKKIILGVGYIWNKRKGIDDFIELSKKISDEYKIVLVGTNDQIDKILPNNILSIHRTYNQEELIKIYSASDVFVNPTREDNFPTTNIESLACGTPVITYQTGGSAEIIDENCGFCVKTGDIDTLIERIIFTCNKKPFSKNACVSRAKQFGMHDKYKEYINLFNSLI